VPDTKLAFELLPPRSTRAIAYNAIQRNNVLFEHKYTHDLDLKVSWEIERHCPRLSAVPFTSCMVVMEFSCVWCSGDEVRLPASMIRCQAIRVVPCSWNAC
jgi:hypothetical protein